jgi:hypothetical protein
MACFWFVWKERGIGGIHKNHSWSYDSLFWNRSPSKADLFLADCTAPKEPCGGCIGFFETLAMMPTCSIAIMWMKRLS